MNQDKRSTHAWKFFRAGGFDQVKLETGADLMALDQLDLKLWVALACPTSGLEFDKATLALIDTDKDGRVRAPELIAAVKWAGGLLKNPDDLLKGSPTLRAGGHQRFHRRRQADRHLRAGRSWARRNQRRSPSRKRRRRPRPSRPSPSTATASCPPTPPATRPPRRSSTTSSRASGRTPTRAANRASARPRWTSSSPMRRPTPIGGRRRKATPRCCRSVRTPRRPPPPSKRSRSRWMTTLPAAAWRPSTRAQ